MISWYCATQTHGTGALWQTHR